MKKLFYLLVIALFPNLCLAESVNLSDVKVWDSQGNHRGTVNVNCNVVDSLGFGVSFMLPVPFDPSDDENMVVPCDEYICYSFPKAMITPASDILPPNTLKIIKKLKIDGEKTCNPKYICTASPDHDTACIFGSLGDCGKTSMFLMPYHGAVLVLSIPTDESAKFNEFIEKAVKSGIIDDPTRIYGPTDTELFMEYLWNI